MMDATQPLPGQIIRLARVVPAKPDAIFRALTDPTLVKSWWGKTEKRELVECEIDASQGGKFRYGIRTASGAEEAASGQFLRFRSPYRLVFSWTSPTAGPADSRVTLDLVDLKDGTTRVIIVHEGLPTPTAVNSNQAGWHDLIQDLDVHFSEAV